MEPPHSPRRCQLLRQLVGPSQVACGGRTASSETGRRGKL